MSWVVLDIHLEYIQNVDGDLQCVYIYICKYPKHLLDLHTGLAAIWEDNGSTKAGYFHQQNMVNRPVKG